MRGGEQTQQVRVADAQAQAGVVGAGVAAALVVAPRGAAPARRRAWRQQVQPAPAHTLALHHTFKPIPEVKNDFQWTITHNTPIKQTRFTSHRAYSRGPLEQGARDWPLRGGV